MKNEINCQQNSSQNRAKYMYMQSVLFQLLEKTQIRLSLKMSFWRNFRELCISYFLFQFFCFCFVFFFSKSQSLKFKRLRTNSR